MDDVYINTMKTTFIFKFRFFSKYKFTSKQGESVKWQLLFVYVHMRNVYMRNVHMRNVHMRNVYNLDCLKP